MSSSAAAARSTSSTTGCGACCPVSGESPFASSSRPKAPRNRVISLPSKLSAKITSCDQLTGSGAAARSRSAIPHRRRCSIVRVLVVLARGRVGSTVTRGSITTQRTPRRPSSMAAARPAGPPPTMTTSVERPPPAA